MTNKVRPIKPSEVTEQKKVSFPDEVLKAFNELIVKNMRGNSATFKQEDIVALIIQKMGLKQSERSKIYDNNWLDVEDVYRAEGWHVRYDKPAYCETYEPTFTFSRHK